MDTASSHASLTRTARLTHCGVIRASGADSVSFLQGQLTNDVASMRPDEARLAGFCSAKGRLQASFVVCKAAAADELWLVCSASVLPATLKRLSMFVLRARCKLSDASDELPIWGLAGDRAGVELAVWQTGPTTDGGRTIRLPDAAGQRRALIVGAEPSAPASMPLDAWRWLEVQSGLATIEAATVDQFVPQMLNYELVGGVDFKKGCYPGQEVVARSQYRGTVKRRSFLFDVDGPAAAGQEVFHSTDPGQPAGRIVNAAPRPASDARPVSDVQLVGDARPVSDAFSALVEVKLAALVDGSLHLGDVAGPVLRRRELPYPVPIDSLDAV